MKRWRYDRILSSENILITNSHIWIGLDILLGLKTEGILQHCTASLSWDREWEYHVWVEVWVWVWVCRLPLPLPILSQDTVGIGVWSVTAQSPGSATSQPPVLLSSVMLGPLELSVPQRVQQTSTDWSYFLWCVQQSGTASASASVQHRNRPFS